MLMASPAIADPNRPIRASGKAVSTSPTAQSENELLDNDVAKASAESSRPLTRKAVQLKIDSTSPLSWLNRFGRVEVEQRK